LRDVLTLWGTLPQETYQEHLELGSDTQPEIIIEKKIPSTKTAFKMVLKDFHWLEGNCRQN